LRIDNTCASLDQVAIVAVEVSRHAKLSDEKNGAATRIDRQYGSTVPAVVDFTDLLLDAAVAADEIERHFVQLAPEVGQQFIGKNAHG
jgi:hypothetical protein